MILTVLLAGCSGARDGADNTPTPGPATTQPATGEIDGSFDVGGHRMVRAEARVRCGGGAGRVGVELEHAARGMDGDKQQPTLGCA